MYDAPAETHPWEVIQVTYKVTRGVENGRAGMSKSASSFTSSFKKQVNTQKYRIVLRKKNACNNHITHSSFYLEKTLT